MSVTFADVARLQAWWAARSPVVFVPSTDGRRSAFAAGARTALERAGVPDASLSQMVAMLRRTTETVPENEGRLSCVLFGDDAGVSPETALEATVHGAHHARQAKDAMWPREGWGGLAQPGQRGRREADAFAAGFFAKSLVTGKLPSSAEAAAELVSGPWHLGYCDLSVARQGVVSHVETIIAGMCPPISSAIEVLAWFREQAPHAIRLAPFAR